MKLSCLYGLYFFQQVLQKQFAHTPPFAFKRSNGIAHLAPESAVNDYRTETDKGDTSVIPVNNRRSGGAGVRCNLVRCSHIGKYFSILLFPIFICDMGWNWRFAFFTFPHSFCKPLEPLKHCFPLMLFSNTRYIKFEFLPRYN